MQSSTTATNSLSATVIVSSPNSRPLTRSGVTDFAFAFVSLAKPTVLLGGPLFQLALSLAPLVLARALSTTTLSHFFTYPSPLHPLYYYARSCRPPHCRCRAPCVRCRQLGESSSTSRPPPAFLPLLTSLLHQVSGLTTCEPSLLSWDASTPPYFLSSAFLLHPEVSSLMGDVD